MPLHDVWAYFQVQKPETRSGSRSTLSWALHSRLCILPPALHVPPAAISGAAEAFSVMEEQKQLCLCLQLHTHMQLLHSQTCSAHVQATGEAAWRLLNHLRKENRFNMWVKIHEWKGQTGNTENMCLSFFQSIRLTRRHIFTGLLFWKEFNLKFRFSSLRLSQRICGELN